MDVQKYLSEALGTFVLVFVGAGAVLAATTANLGMVGIALAHGLALFAVVAAFGHLSGAHVNPAVTFAKWVTGGISLKEGVSYVISQLVGAAVAGLLLSVAFPFAPAALNLGAPGLASGVTPGTGVLLEALLTFLLVLTIYGVAGGKSGRSASSLAIGAALAFGVLVGGGSTGGALNPARAFGPALASGEWTSHWVWWVGPLLGALVAGLVYKHILTERR